MRPGSQGEPQSRTGTFVGFNKEFLKPCGTDDAAGHLQALFPSSR